VLIVGGSGDTGQLLAKLIHPRGGEVVVTSRRRPADLPESLLQHAQAVQADPVSDPPGFAAALRRLRQEGPLDVVVDLLAAWLREPEPVILGGLGSILSGLKKVPGGRSTRLIFVGSTRVYGDRPGERLTEDSDLKLDNRTGRLMARAEEMLWSAQGRGETQPVILRPPHVYGPGRERVFELMRQGRFFIAGHGQNRMHHLHAADFARMLCGLCLAPARDVVGRTFNAVEDEPAPYRDYCDFITERSGVPPLGAYPIEEAIGSGLAARLIGPHFAQEPILREFYANMTADQVIDNTRIKQTLGLELLYPSFHRGLQEMLQPAESVSVSQARPTSLTPQTSSAT
jgi:nucleoside-diphosphate-sugar epimerase